MEASKKWTSYARILEYRGVYHTDITSNGCIFDYTDDEKFMLEEEFLTWEDARDDLIHQGYKWNDGVNMYSITLEQEEVTVAEVFPWDHVRNKELARIYKG